MILKSNKLVFIVKVFKFINRVRFEIQFWQYSNCVIYLYKKMSLILKSNKLVFIIKILNFNRVP